MIINHIKLIYYKFIYLEIKTEDVIFFTIITIIILYYKVFFYSPL